MLWQITKYHLFRSSIHSFVLFFFLSFSFFWYVHLQYFVPQWPCFAIMAFFAIVWRMYHQQHFMLTCQCVHHCAVLHFIMEMLSKPLGHHSLIHWIKTTTTTTTATTCERNIHPPAPIIQSHVPSQCVRLRCSDLPLRIIVILWSILFSVSSCALNATSIHLVSIHLFYSLIPFRPHNPTPTVHLFDVFIFGYVATVVLLPVVVCTCFGT